MCQRLAGLKHGLGGRLDGAACSAWRGKAVALNCLVLRHTVAWATKCVRKLANMGWAAVQAAKASQTQPQPHLLARQCTAHSTYSAPNMDTTMAQEEWPLGNDMRPSLISFELAAVVHPMSG